MDMLIRHIFISPAHNFVGHHGKPPGDSPALDVPEVRLLAGRGIEGDRYLDFKDDYKGQVTFFAWEVYERLCAQFRIHDKSPGVLRRNFITEEVDLNALIGVRRKHQLNKFWAKRRSHG